MNALTFPHRLVKPVLFDLAALALVYLVPSLVHLTSIPVYMIEPMRLVLILAMVHTSKHNALLLALTLPFFSFMVSGHPQLLKAAIIAVELVCNVLLFYLLAKQIANYFFALLIAIIVSKVICYMLYLVLFSWSFVVEESGTTFLIAQGVTSLVFSVYGYLAAKRQMP